MLIDGRSVYTPLGCVLGRAIIEDIERIEVISGPGETLWGTNAVNGVINIITRSAKNTQGGPVAAAGGNHESEAAVRHGGNIGDDGHYRIYAKYFDPDNTATGTGLARSDAWHKGQVDSGPTGVVGPTNSQCTAMYTEAPKVSRLPA